MISVGSKNPRQIAFIRLWYPAFNSLRIWITEPKAKLIFFNRPSYGEYHLWFFGLFFALRIHAWPWHRNPSKDKTHAVFHRAERWKAKRDNKRPEKDT